MINLKEEKKKLEDYLRIMSSERGYLVKDHSDHSIEVFWPRYKGDYDVKITFEARGVGFCYVEITYRCHTRIKHLSQYGNLFSLDYGLTEEMVRHFEKDIVENIEWFEEKNV